MRNYDPTSRKLQQKLCDLFWQAEHILFSNKKMFTKINPVVDMAL
jgi:hypothetical protein